MTEDILQNISIEFSEGSLLLLNLCLGFIMFGVALDIKVDDFKFKKSPKPLYTGLISQFILLPLLTFLLIAVLQPHPMLSLGMILVACCPGGNVSNFISSISNANIALSVGLTALTTLVAPFFTPFNFTLWSSLIPGAENIISDFNISYSDVFETIILLLAFPLISGMALSKNSPKITAIISKPIKILSFIILLGFIAVALFKNIKVFEDYLHIVFLLVLAHNSIAFTGGYLFARLLKNTDKDCRSISIETGIQNSGLGLIIIFNFFDGNGAMALVAAWWGVWHIIGGLAASWFFRKSKSISIKS